MQGLIFFLNFFVQAFLFTLKSFVLFMRFHAKTLCTITLGVLRQTLLFSKGQFLLFSLFFSFFPNISHLTLHFLPLFLQFSLRISHHRVKSNENLRSAIWKLRGSFFLSFFLALSDWKRTNRKERVNKDKMWKKWNDADVSVAFSALKCPFYAVLLRFASALAKVNVHQEKDEKEGKK